MSENIELMEMLESLRLSGTESMELLRHSDGGSFPLLQPSKILPCAIPLPLPMSRGPPSRSSSSPATPVVVWVDGVIPLAPLAQDLDLDIGIVVQEEQDVF